MTSWVTWSLGQRVLGESVSNFKSKTLGIRRDARLDPVTLGIPNGDYLQVAELYPIPATYNLGVSCDDLVWDMELSSTTPPLTYIRQMSTTDNLIGEKL